MWEMGLKHLQHKLRGCGYQHPGAAGQWDGSLVLLTSDGLHNLAAHTGWLPPDTRAMGRVTPATCPRLCGVQEDLGLAPSIQMGAWCPASGQQCGHPVAEPVEDFQLQTYSHSSVSLPPLPYFSFRLSRALPLQNPGLGLPSPAPSLPVSCSHLCTEAHRLLSPRRLMGTSPRSTRGLQPPLQSCNPVAYCPSCISQWEPTVFFHLSTPEESFSISTCLHFA